MKHLTEMEREISAAAAKAYREAIRLIWAYPESQWDLERNRVDSPLLSGEPFKPGRGE